MQEKLNDGLTQIADGIESLKKVHLEKPISPFMQMVFDAKADEVVNIFSGAPSDLKNQVKLILDEINPSNSGKYNRIAQ